MKMVGMSTVCDIIIAVQTGMKVVGLSFILNKACGLSNNKLSMEEVIENSNKNKEQYAYFMNKLVGGDYN